MEIVYSEVDKRTHYKLMAKHLVIYREGDEMKMDYTRIEELASVFKPEIKAEILSIHQRVNGKVCPICGTEFIPERRQKIYCQTECASEAKRRQIKESVERRAAEAEKKKKKKHIPQLNALVKEANSKGISYGMLQAQKYMEAMRKEGIL